MLHPQRLTEEYSVSCRRSYPYAEAEVEYMALA